MKVLRISLLLILFLFSNRSFGACEVPEYRTIQSIKAVVDVIRECKVTSIEHLLKLLPHDFRRRYNLVYVSRALGRANPEFPRVIHSGFQNRLTLTYGTLATDPLYHSIEMMEYSEVDHQFHFQIIHFNQSIFHPESDLVFKTEFSPVWSEPSAPKVSLSDPGKCLGCHQKILMGTNTPIWDLYPMWPGVYGSTHDADTFNIHPSSTVRYFLTEGKAYDQYIRPFIGNESSGSRLGYLKPIFDEKEEIRFRSGLAVSANFEELTNRSNLEALKRFTHERKIDSQQFKYFLFYAVGCVGKAINQYDQIQVRTVEEFKARLLRFVSPDLYQRMIRENARLLGISSDNDLEVLTVMSYQIVKNMREKQLKVYSKVVSGFNMIASYMGLPAVHEREIDEIMRDEGAVIGEGTSPREFDISLMQWPDVMMLSMYFNALGFPYEEWMHDGSLLSYFNNNTNHVHEMLHAIYQTLDFESSDSELNTFLRTVAMNPWPMLGDFDRLITRRQSDPSVETRFKAFCENTIRPKSVALTDFQ